jgi:hypothetical protein
MGTPCCVSYTGREARADCGLERISGMRALSTVGIMRLTAVPTTIWNREFGELRSKLLTPARQRHAKRGPGKIAAMQVQMSVTKCR